MTPNLFVATQKVFQPHRWFKNRSSNERPQRRTEHWESPIPGVYEYIPGRGWYLVATYKNGGTEKSAVETITEGGSVGSVPDHLKETIKMTPPVPVRYSKVLKKYLLGPDYEMRKKYGTIEDYRGKSVQVGFFKLDDEVAWVNCWDEEGEFIPGPYKLWCIDARTNKFRHMLRGDDPEYQRSQSNSRAVSRANSPERPNPNGSRRSSQESRSTQYRPTGSIRDGSSKASTRANSYVGSASTSQANSRRNSFTRGQRSPRIVLDEVGPALRKAALEQAVTDRA